VSETINETIDELKRSLREYVEATYHISEARLVAQRRALLETIGVIHQRPFLESTPRYVLGMKFQEIAGLDPTTVNLLKTLAIPDSSGRSLVYDPPYQHQAGALEQALVNGKSLMITTGTGSGKTESFLLPILGKLAQEAASKKGSFAHPAVRALVLYPMNALVNDQLGRLRLLFGDKRVVDMFKAFGGRPARFARYTSRALYPGVRDPKKDQDRLSPIATYYVRHLIAAEDPSHPKHEESIRLVSELRKRGKWPAKSNLVKWFGAAGAKWKDKKTGDYKRCVLMPDDPELITRHEVQTFPPDVLVTNYSMLEYMLMRPLERPIFDTTREWLQEFPDEYFMLVLDEAHLYKGAGGSEVALLIRRLRSRLGIEPARMRVICTTASFSDLTYAPVFGAELTGKSQGDFVAIGGKLALRSPVAVGGAEDARILAEIDLGAFYDASEDDRLTLIQPLLEYRGVTAKSELPRALFDALREFPPLNLLVNMTMKKALPLEDLGTLLFPGVEIAVSSRAVTTLLALGSVARCSPDQPGLLPCRVHSFYRGLPGLWVCMDPECQALPEELRGGPAGKMYSQPLELCECGSRVLEMFTCRNCGTAYARAYTDDIDNPNYLWSEPGSEIRTPAGQRTELAPLDILLEKPTTDEIEPAEYDLDTGRLNPIDGTRIRTIYLKKNRTLGTAESDQDIGGSTTESNGEFKPCGVCGQVPRYGRSSVQDHQTKGDQPFQALIAKQIQVQPPSSALPSRLAPLRGRKVLVFSDSRQTAARLAPNLQQYSTQDALRPLIIFGYTKLQESSVQKYLSLEDLLLAVLLGAKILEVRLRPELKSGENFAEELTVEQAVVNVVLSKETELLQLLIDLRTSAAPESLLESIVDTFSNRYYGLEALALCSIVESPKHSALVDMLPDIAGVATTSQAKRGLLRAWLRHWQKLGFWLGKMPQAWWKLKVKSHANGNFTGLRYLLTEKASRKVFEKDWLPVLLQAFTEVVPGNQYRLKGSELSLLIGGEWAYCDTCRNTQRLIEGLDICVNCGRHTAKLIDPDTDPVFVARKGYYRASTVDVLRRPPIPPISLIAAEHTAQINTAQTKEVFSKAEENELLFQDVDLGPDDQKHERPAIDVLSCTTTMEVGIDIGALSGVALRNMPPARANYQQRSGRAGRRGNAVATVTAFGSSDSHDEHYFTNPEQMISGKVEDPKLTLDNYEITRRHVTAFLLQQYHQERLPDIAPEEQPHLFAVLGTVSDFKRPEKSLNRDDFAKWLSVNKDGLVRSLEGWVPLELSGSARKRLMDGVVTETLESIDQAIELENVQPPGKSEPQLNSSGSLESQQEPLEPVTDDIEIEVPAEEGETAPTMGAANTNLLDRLLYKGVLPRYAFPTDVANFYIFDSDRSTRFRPAFKFSPSQGLSVALSQYAPGKEVWISGKKFTCGALYSPIGKERFAAWRDRRLYYECEVCQYACTKRMSKGHKGETLDCPACGGSGTLGPARYWLRPPGFAHPVSTPEGVSPDEPPAKSYATRAKLVAPTPAGPSTWIVVNDRIKVHHLKEHLLVTNRGPKQDGYTYCTVCGVIEPSVSPNSIVASSHRKPYPDDKMPLCPGGGATNGIVLGTDFITNVLLISLRVDKPLVLQPTMLATDVALRTLSEAISKAACSVLGLEPTEIQGEYRPALSPLGRVGGEVELYLYDTLAGGAGFVQQVGERIGEVLDKALIILEKCPASCDKSCYRCLRSYKNKFEHGLLDRKLGATLLKHLLTGAGLEWDAARTVSSTGILYNDLKRLGVEGITFERNAPLNVPGAEELTVPILATTKSGYYVVALSGPLTLNEPLDPGIKDLKECSSIPVLLVDELLVRSNLPRASSNLLLSLN